MEATHGAAVTVSTVLAPTVERGNRGDSWGSGESGGGDDSGESGCQW